MSFFSLFCVQDVFSKISPVAYIDVLDGDAEGHIRFHTPEEAKAVSDTRAELQKTHSWKLEILSGMNFDFYIRKKSFLFLCGLHPRGSHIHRRLWLK